MGALKVQVSSSFPRTERPAYTGKLIASLFELVEKAEKRLHADDDGSHPKSRGERLREDRSGCSV
jgi:hypothetical protein